MRWAVYPISNTIRLVGNTSWIVIIYSAVLGIYLIVTYFLIIEKSAVAVERSVVCVFLYIDDE